MRAFSYVVEHDLGFAPNPFHGICTLACCKPKIRKIASVGDFILGMGAARPKLTGHLCYWMLVDEIVTFDEYWSDARFRKKKPNMNGPTYMRYGDNIYHRENGVYRQSYSFHSLPGGATSHANLQRDTGTTDRVLIGRTFCYWGENGIPMPSHLQDFVIEKRPSHLSRFREERLADLTSWLMQLPERGEHGEPAQWQFLARKRRRPSQPLTPLYSL